MEPSTLEALKESIEHWERIAIEKDLKERIGVKNCALCRLFNPYYTDSDEFGCLNECPVKENTGRNFCFGTPYSKVEEHWSQEKFNQHLPQSDEFYAAALEELNFLKSLLPKDKETISNGTNV